MINSVKGSEILDIFENSYFWVMDVWLSCVTK